MLFHVNDDNYLCNCLPLRHVDATRRPLRSLRRALNSPSHEVKASLLMACYAGLPERQFREQTGYSAPFKWSLRLHSVPALDARSRTNHSARPRERRGTRLLEALAARVPLERSGRGDYAAAFVLPRSLHGRRHAAGGSGFAQVLPRAMRVSPRR